MQQQEEYTPIEVSPLRYRIVYDALARISCHINQCEHITDLIACLNADVKYLFDCAVLRFCLKGTSYLRTLCIGKDMDHNEAHWYSATHFTFPFEEENQLRDTPSSFEGNELIRAVTGSYFPEKVLASLDAVWVLPFHFPGDYTLTVSVFSSEQRRFRASDIPVLRILCESLFAKIRSLRLFEEVITTRNKLQETLEALSEQNERITELVEEQEAIIQLRTQELQERNSKLSELVAFNSHNIREPLSRILGLVAVSKLLTEREIIDDIIPRINVSSEDLDDAIKNVIQFIDQDESLKTSVTVLEAPEPSIA